MSFSALAIRCISILTKIPAITNPHPSPNFSPQFTTSPHKSQYPGAVGWFFWLPGPQGVPNIACGVTITSPQLNQHGIACFPFRRADCPSHLNVHRDHTILKAVTSTWVGHHR